MRREGTGDPRNEDPEQQGLKEVELPWLPMNFTMVSIGKIHALKH